MRHKILKVIKSTTKWSLIVGALCAMIVTASILLFVNIKLQSLPPIDAVYLNTYGPTKILDKDNNVIYEDTQRIVQNITYDELPELYAKGIVAVEDHDFWESRGYSIKGLLTATLGKRGGSTIEQQLIKNTYYNGGQGIDKYTRKIHEVFLAMQMNENIEKKDILTYYVNKLELGENTVGIKSAMKVYFNKTPDQYSDKTPENIAQLAYLTGLGQAPTTYDLYLSDDGLERKDIILSIWQQSGLITEEEYNEAKTFDLKSTLAERFHASEQQWAINKRYKTYTDQVLEEVKELGYDTKNASLTIHTFLDQDLYKKIEDTVYAGEYLDDNQQVAATVINHDGVVIGMVGGRSRESEWNRAVQNTRSSGSSMKPFTAYGPLLQYFGNNYNTASRFDTSNYVYPGTNYVMRNYAGATYGMLDMQQSLRWSLNTPVARIDDEILGSTRMKTFLHGLGLDVKDEYSANDGIGLNISTLQAAAAYNALDNGGIYTRPRFIKSIDFVDGTSKEIDARRHRAMNESVAYVLTQMLRGVPQPISMGSAPAAMIPQYEGYAGKTGSVAFADGQNNNYAYGPGGSDIWYDSITRDGYSVSIWMGYDNPNDDPQIPDHFKSYQVINKNLQLMLNADRSSIPNWDRPDTVKSVGGSGLREFLAVTDAGDVEQSYTPSLTQLPDIPAIQKVKPKTEVNKEWNKNMTERDKKSYELYKNHPEYFDNLDILNDSTYKTIQGKVE